MDHLKPILERSVPIGAGLDLRSGTDVALHRSMRVSSIDICADFGAPVLRRRFYDRH